MDYTKIRTDRQFKDATGKSKEEFEKLLLDFEATYIENKGQTYEEYIAENVKESPKLSTLGQALFFVLFQLKNDLIFGSLGVVFRMCVASANNNFKYFSKLLEQTLEKKKVMPKRSFETVEEFEEHIKDASEIIFDGTENPTERPQGYENQKDKYSGKKKMHTDVAMILSDKATWIYYVSLLYPGSNVDFGILKKEFPVEKDWFKNCKILVDLGFVGIGKIYLIKELIIGEKKPRTSKKNPNPKLTEEQKEKNRQVSRERIFVEHAIGKMKNYRILKNKCRIKCQVLKNRIVGICAGLWNYHLALSN